jgi:hypothetical protein
MQVEYARHTAQEIARRVGKIVGRFFKSGVFTQVRRETGKE